LLEKERPAALDRVVAIVAEKTQMGRWGHQPKDDGVTAPS
jgi:hypothetical protein